MHETYDGLTFNTRFFLHARGHPRKHEISSTRFPIVQVRMERRLITNLRTGSTSRFRFPQNLTAFQTKLQKLSPHQCVNRVSPH